MNRHEKPDRRKPIIVKVGNAAVKIYQGKSRGYDLFTVVHYAGGQRKRETFAKFSAFGGNKLPYKVKTSSAIGKMMVSDANTLNSYNNGLLTLVCTP
jgi:hypothetical protein